MILKKLAKHSRQTDLSLLLLIYVQLGPANKIREHFELTKTFSNKMCYILLITLIEPRVCYKHWKIISKFNPSTIVWPHFCRTQLHSLHSGDFAQVFEPASYFWDWTCFHLITSKQKAPKFDFQSQLSLSKVSFIILIFVSAKIIRLGEQLIIRPFFDNLTFWKGSFFEIGPYFCGLTIKWMQVQSQK